jgi:hypothetical protein
MAVDDFLPFPNTILEVVKHCTKHACVVVKAGDPKVKGDVTVKCKGLWDDKESNWIPKAGMSVGSTSSGGQGSGKWNPSRPGEYGLIGFISGNPMYPYYEPFGPGASGKGDPGSS